MCLLKQKNKTFLKIASQQSEVKNKIMSDHAKCET